MAIAATGEMEYKSPASERASRARARMLARLGARDALIIGLLMLFVIALSMFFFSGQSLRLDEAQSLWQSSHTPAKILNVIAQDVHVPLYHMILHFWQLFMGNDVTGARVLSLFFFVLTIPAMYLLGTFAYNRSIGLFGALLFSISPFLNWYGNEIRMYSLFTLITILNQFFFLKLYRKNATHAWVGYTLTVLLGIYTHYFFFLVLATQALFYIMYRHRFAVGSFKKFLIVAAVAAVAFSPWLYYVYNLGSANNTRPLLQAPTTINLFNTFSQFIFGFQNDHLNTLLVSLWPLTVLIGVLALRSHRRVSSVTIFFLLSLVLPIALVFIFSSVMRPIFVTRYLILTVPALYLFLGWVFSTYPKELRVTFKTILVGSMLLTLGVQAVSAAVPLKEDYRSAAYYLTEHAVPQDVIILSAPFTVYPFEYYYKGHADIETLPRWDRFTTGAIPPFDPEKLEAEIETIKANHQIAWVLLSYDQGYESDVKQAFDTRFHRVDVKNFSPGLNLYAYKLRYDSPDLDEIIRRQMSEDDEGDDVRTSGGTTTPAIATSTSE